MKEENYRLIKLAQSGDKSALEELTLKNSGLIWASVRKFSGRGVDIDDLFQIGAIGLIKAINKFDTSFNVEFSTYAVPMILGEIRRFLRDDGIIKVSRNLKEIAASAKNAAEKIYLKEGREATVFEIAQEINCSVSDVTLSLEATQPTESIYRSIHDGENSQILLIDKINSDTDKEENLLTSMALRQAIDTLPSRERQILLLRYYKEKTQSEVAKIMGVSQVQISRIEKKLLGILRKKIG
ncbi:MAG: SigB/SigF/SigG family RNA polymerase sigma factor [Clostridia bacterium]|nr:SigB/SigF/SigG family RNA polymerase sigma factor [Clostridia bacterium]